MTWADVLSHSIAFLSGALTGAAGKYLADKFTDQRHRQEEQAARDRRWAKIRAAMPALLDEMKEDLTKQPLVREFVVLEHEGLGFAMGKGPLRFRYFEEKHPNLRGLLAILENAEYIYDVSPVPPIYRMTEAFVEQVTR